MKCTCAEWKPNIEKVNEPLMFLLARNPSTSQQYDGVPFRFCPWCASPLVKDDPPIDPDATLGGLPVFRMREGESTHDFATRLAAAVLTPGGDWQ